MIPAVREAHPEFLFLAEAYWDLEWALQQQGFNYCYDKRLYDRILHGPAEQVRLHLLADDEYQRGLVRFVENHDEPRAASAFGSTRSQVAAVDRTDSDRRPTGPQRPTRGSDGPPTGVPGPIPHRANRRSPSRLLSHLPASRGRPDIPAAETGNCANGPDGRETIDIKTLSPGAGTVIPGGSSWSISATARQRVWYRSPWEDLRGRMWNLVDPTHPTQNIAFVRSGDDLVDGFFVELEGWNWHMFRIDPITDHVAR